ncbi:MAG TPA: hypothetical protein VKJ77_16685, partial [Caballeronia sp.]|nr:hypothetical protein [Caballeronia sp.]
SNAGKSWKQSASKPAFGTSVFFISKNLSETVKYVAFRAHGLEDKDRRGYTVVTPFSETL